MGFCSQNYCRRLYWLYLEGHIHLCSALLLGSGLRDHSWHCLGKHKHLTGYILLTPCRTLLPLWPPLGLCYCILTALSCAPNAQWRSGGQVSWEPMWVMSFICSKCFTHAGKGWRKRAGRNRENQPACLAMLGETAGHSEPSLNEQLMPVSPPEP